MFAQCQDNVTEWDIGSWSQRPDFLAGQNYKVTISVTSWYPHHDMTLDVAGHKTPTTNQPSH